VVIVLCNIRYTWKLKAREDRISTKAGLCLSLCIQVQERI